MGIRIEAAGLSGVALVLALAASAPAQTRSPAAPAAAAAPAPASVEPRGDVEAAVDVIMRLRNRGETVSYKKGWHAGASYRIVHLISVMAEVGGDYRTLPGYTAHIYSYSGGVRFESEAPQPALKPFAQITMGGAQDNGDGTGTTNHYPVVSPGGGLDVRLSSRAAFRLRLDFPLYMTFGDVFKGTRVAVGVSMPFGSRR